MESKEKINGLNPRHVAQIVRRNTLVKVKNSKKLYSRKNKSNVF